MIGVFSSAQTDRQARIKKRHAAEVRFKLYGLFSIFFSLGFLLLLLSSIFIRGYGAFWQTNVTVPIFFDSSIIDPLNLHKKNPLILFKANYKKLAQEGLKKRLHHYPTSRSALREINNFLSDNASVQLRDMVLKDPSLLGKTRSVDLLVSGHVDSAFKGLINLSVDQKRRKISDQQVRWMNQLHEDGFLAKKFNYGFFSFGDSSRSETSGIRVALLGSLYIMLIVFLLALPIGVATGIYLEEFSIRNRITDLIEIIINNLAAVPSIVFGILGLSFFVNFLGLPRSSALVGGITLSLMTLPVIVVVTRSSLSSVPDFVRLGALALGASKVQMVFHRVVPLAIPGILTGGIIGLARALGETAPLLIIGMVAFVANPPLTPFDPSTALPVQLYMWANQAERAFAERTFGVIIVLLLFLMLMNIFAIFLRKRFQKHW